jgi:hypothetical protein
LAVFEFVAMAGRNQIEFPKKLRKDLFREY